MQAPPLPVLYEDDFFIAVNKPHNFLAHRTTICPDKISAVQIVRELTGTKANPVHRIDRATAGVLLFAKDKESTKFASEQFMNHDVEKTYLAIIRGWPSEEEGLIDSSIVSYDGKEQEAETEYKVLKKVDYPVSVGRFSSNWYSLIRALPKTGRMHQIRRHMKRLSGPVIGDTNHGDGRQNKVFREYFNLRELLLFAESLKFKNMDDKKIHITAPLPASFQTIFKEFTWSEDLTKNESIKLEP